MITTMNAVVMGLSCGAAIGLSLFLIMLTTMVTSMFLWNRMERSHKKELEAKLEQQQNEVAFQASGRCEPGWLVYTHDGRGRVCQHDLESDLVQVQIKETGQTQWYRVSDVSLLPRI